MTAFSYEDIRAIVSMGQLSDKMAEVWLVECLVKRRDKVGRAYFAKLLPLDKFRISDSKLVFEDLAAARGIGKAREYTVRWKSLDESGHATALPYAGPNVPDFREAKYLAATVACTSGDGGCGNPVVVHIRQRESALEVVGIDR